MSPQKNDPFQIHDAHWEHKNILKASRVQIVLIMTDQKLDSDTGPNSSLCGHPFCQKTLMTSLWNRWSVGQNIAEVLQISIAGSWSADYHCYNRIVLIDSMQNFITFF